MGINAIHSHTNTQADVCTVKRCDHKGQSNTYVGEELVVLALD